MAGTLSRPGEFELIERYFRPLATHPGAFGLVDDAASLACSPGEDLVLTTDLVASDVHFFRDDAPGSIARKALRVNLSDLAAKGAAPVGYLLAIALAADWTEAWIAGFAEALAGDQERYGISLLGGDTSRAAGGTTITITAIGRLPAGTIVRRSGARPGDRIFVSGTIGDAALGLRIRQGGLDAVAAGAAGRDALLDRYLHPRPRVTLAAAVRECASAALDVSDGLVGDLRHICRASGVTATVQAGAVPLSPAARAILDRDRAALATVLTGGDDYEVLATVPPARAPAFVRAAAIAGVTVTEIGEVLAGEGAPRILGLGGEPLRLDTLSHTHF